jgi:multisubunit Na+/H+ antiporter MnhB subunit
MPEIKYYDIGNGLIHLVFIAVYFASIAISMRHEKQAEDKTTATRGCFLPIAAFSCLGVGLALLLTWGYFLSKSSMSGEIINNDLLIPVVGQISIAVLLITTSIAIVGNFRGALNLYFTALTVFIVTTIYSLIFYETSEKFSNLNLLSLVSLSALLILLLSGGFAYALQTLRILSAPPKRPIQLVRKLVK